MKILMLGLDNAGKTTILYNLNGSEVITQIPIIGLIFEKCSWKNVEILSWDLGGSHFLWRLY